MKATVIVCLCAFLAGSQAVQTRVSPITRVVNLLKSLSDQIEKDGKIEEDLYEGFVCWGKSVIEQKTASNSEASTRIDALATYIADLAGGKVELTSEREDLIKDVATLQAGLDQSKAMREKEAKDFDSAEDEMKKAIAAMGSAIKVMNEATKDNKKGALLAYRTQLNGGMEALEAESASLNAAVDLGERFLTKSDSSFLRHVLTGDVPAAAPNDKLLRSKATFKMAYKTRSGKIQGVLAKLKATFVKNLDDATKKENAALATYTKLTKSKTSALKKLTDAQSSMSVEGGARGKANANADEEKKALEKQVTDDSKFIKQTEDSLATKKTEWEERSKLRQGELDAISKAIGILYSDDARDNFKKSYSSQEGFFLQEASSTTAAALGRTVTVLKNVARRTGDKRMALLADLVAAAPKNEKGEFKKFKPVLAAIDKMLVTLKNDEKTDLQTKETCESERMENTRDALLLGRAMDDQTDAIRKLKSEMEELSAEMKKLLADKSDVNDELTAATKNRKAENDAWKTTDSEDTLAASTVKDAQKVLKDYYSTAFKSLVQVNKAVAPTVVDGEAPPPPAATWDSGYGGKKGESTGIISILEMVHADILKDQEKAKTEEGESLSDYNKFKKSAEDKMKALQKEHDTKEGQHGEKEKKKVETIKARSGKKTQWDTEMKLLEDNENECEYYAVNFKLRASNRALEVDGLNNAKAILQGGSFK